MSDVKKLRIGWFTFTCCEDSTIIFTELLNTHWQQWLPKLEFIHAKVLQSKNRWEPMDIAFVEGAISNSQQEEKLKKIRGLATRLIAVGACAVTGMPSAARNLFNDEQKEMIKQHLERFPYNEKVKRLDEVVSVDDKLPGCPMNERQFVEKLEGLFREFGI